MTFENSTYSKTYNFYKLEMPFGNFFFCDKFIISEINAEVHFDWNKIELVLKEAIKFYGLNAKLGYISNRVNSYSVDPQDWAKIAIQSNMMAGSSIVYYNYMMYLNATLEKRFSVVKMHPCLSLDEAIEWISNLDELN
ncbi:hypothetical protein VOI54_16735 [Tamlana sp. 2201CG12-4]|nr:hypothetical protein [Tamlana sp. 2201CG12-4]